MQACHDRSSYRYLRSYAKKFKVVAPVESCADRFPSIAQTQCSYRICLFYGTKGSNSLRKCLMLHRMHCRFSATFFTRSQGSPAIWPDISWSRAYARTLHGTVTWLGSRVRIGVWRCFPMDECARANVSDGSPDVGQSENQRKVNKRKKPATAGFS